MRVYYDREELEMIGDALARASFRTDAEGRFTCVALPPTHNGDAVNKAMKARGFTISAGYGTLKDTSIRIGHMGDHTVAELDVLLETLREVLVG